MSESKSGYVFDAEAYYSIPDPVACEACSSIAVDELKKKQSKETGRIFYRCVDRVACEARYAAWSEASWREIEEYISSK